MKSVFSNLLGSSNGENLKLIGWNEERSLHKKLPKRRWCEIPSDYPIFICSYKFRLCCKCWIILKLLKIHNGKKKKGKTHKRSYTNLMRFWTVELEWFPRARNYSAKGHLNSKWFHLQSSIRQKKWPFSFVLSSTTEVF